MARPNRVTVRPYQVGFGDCFLLTFHYKTGGDRHVLIDFGSTGAPKGFGDLGAVARSIQKECGGKLHAVVATHRHKDHISGFATKANGKGSGDIIAACKPDVVVQPWTEDPAAAPGARAATARARAPKAFVAALQDMHSVAAAVAKEAKRLAAEGSALDGDEDVDDGAATVPAASGTAGSPPRKRQSTLVKQLAFLGETNLANRSAIDNLIRMGKRRGAKAFYVNAGSKSGLETVLPGVKVHVLGPPTLQQSDIIRSQRQRDDSEFWHFQALASRRAVTPSRRLFPKAPILEGVARPKESRWLLRRMRSIRGQQLREIVRILDKAMNNTSVILLFEIGGQLLLFPGDAQIENWRFALSQPKVTKLLERVTFYKVGHHGSLNATPKSLWTGFGNRSKRATATRLRTVVSTMLGKHGDRAHDTEVPRDTLVAALSSESEFFTTQSIKVRNKTLFVPQTIEL